MGTEAAAVVNGTADHTRVIVVGGSRLVITRLNTPEIAVRWGHKVDARGRVRGLFVGCRSLDNLYAVQEVTDCGIRVRRMTLEDILSKFGAAVAASVNQVTGAVDTGDGSGCVSSSWQPGTPIRGYSTIDGYLEINKVVITNVQHIDPSVIGPGVPDISKLKFTVDKLCVFRNRYGELEFAAFGCSSRPRHPHIDSGGRICIDRAVRTTVYTLLINKMYEPLIVVLLEGLRFVNLRDCFGGFRNDNNLTYCESCRRMIGPGQRCNACGRSVCTDCMSEDSTGLSVRTDGICLRCRRAMLERAHIRAVNKAIAYEFRERLLGQPYEPEDPPDYFAALPDTYWDREGSGGMPSLYRDLLDDIWAVGSVTNRDMPNSLVRLFEELGVRSMLRSVAMASAATASTVGYINRDVSRYRYSIASAAWTYTTNSSREGYYRTSWQTNVRRMVELDT